MLSGGQRKRVGLAQVLIRDPKILLMDEPFGPLDAQTRQIMGNLLLDLWNADRKAVLFVTHDLEEAIALADRVVIMSAGPSARIIGDWRYISNGREPDPFAPPSTSVFRLTATESQWMERGVPMPGKGFTAKIQIDWKQNPAAIDLMPKHGGSAIRGIIKLDGDRLTLGWSNNDKRPADFATANNIHHFTRVKK